MLQVYEIGTEVIFTGRQDAMQRQTLVPLSKWVESQGLPQSGEGLKLLEVASGTGRFLTFIRDNYPAMDLTALDISPFYLEVGSCGG